LLGLLFGRENGDDTALTTQRHSPEVTAVKTSNSTQEIKVYSCNSKGQGRKLLIQSHPNTLSQPLHIALTAGATVHIGKKFIVFACSPRSPLSETEKLRISTFIYRTSHFKTSIHLRKFVLCSQPSVRNIPVKVSSCVSFLIGHNVIIVHLILRWSICSTAYSDNYLIIIS
jgi:hypothetical protein